MRILVTGGAGFIGSALVRLLVGTTDATVCTLDKLTYAASRQALAAAEASGRHRLEVADVCDRAALDRVLADFRPDAIAHLAAETHVDRSIDGPSAFIMTNMVGTATLLEAATSYWSGLDRARRDAFRFLHVSTDEVFGSLGPDDPRFDERTAYAPNSPYAASKAGADHLARAWFHTYGLPVLVSNCSNNYGPFQFPEKLIPLMILNGLAGRELPVYGRGDNVRDWLHVEDHASGLIAALTRGRPGGTYCFGGDAEMRNLDVVQRVCDLLDRLRPEPGGPRRRLIRFVTDRPGHDRRYAVDAALARRELGWTPRESFDSGLEATVRWYLENEDWWRPIQERRYSGERLGLGPNLGRGTA